MIGSRRIYLLGTGPSPHGEGGLKFQRHVLVLQVRQSLPTRGGWIEIHGTMDEQVAGVLSLPTRGGWIENRQPRTITNTQRLQPQAWIDG